MLISHFFMFKINHMFNKSLHDFIITYYTVYLLSHEQQSRKLLCWPFVKNALLLFHLFFKPQFLISILISHLNAFFSAITILFFFSLTLLMLSMAKLKISLVNVTLHLHLKYMSYSSYSKLFKYLLILISNIIL